jgi:hypothetical protein
MTCAPRSKQTLYRTSDQSPIVDALGHLRTKNISHSAAAWRGMTAFIMVGQKPPHEGN